MTDVLDQICASKRREVAAARAGRPDVDTSGAAPARPHGFRTDGFGVLAEVKRASPSAGPIAMASDAACQARRYAVGGATAVSVLTDAHFGGSLDDLRAVRAAVDVPVLRKDFVLDPYQVDEARAAGADIVLLIVAMLTRGDLMALADQVRSHGMTPLVEVFDVAEAEAGVEAVAGGGLFGVNARNLRTLDVDLARWEKIAAEVPPDVIRIAESGVRTPSDAQRARAAGYHGVLCGEALMRAPDPATFIAAMVHA